jgi:hypothetical protein
MLKLVLRRTTRQLTAFAQTNIVCLHALCQPKRIGVEIFVEQAFKSWGV